MTFQKSKTCCNSLSSFMTLILLMDNWLVSSVEKVIKSLKKCRTFTLQNHICYVNNTNALFKAFRCTTCDTFFSKTGNLDRHLVTCSDGVKDIYPKNVYELRETLFEKLDAFNTPHRIEKNCSRLRQYLTLSPFVSRRQTHTNKLRLQRQLGSMYLYQFLSRQTLSWNPFFSATSTVISSPRVLSLLSKD